MLITLDVTEVAAIIKEWAYKQYRTHNINVGMATNVKVDLEVIMEDFGSSRPEPNAEFERYLRSNVGNAVTNQYEAGIDLTLAGPALDSGSI